MDGVRKSSDRIAEIVGVIDGIAFRTNLLALNAAVEAARAGDAGRGFAVVAAEVRALSQRTHEAAHEIKSLIRESQQRVDDGVRIVAETGDAAREAETAVETMDALIARIGTAVQQQSAGVGEVNAMVASIDALTQHNAALVEELSAAAASLAHQAESVVQSVRVFRLARAPAAA
jgi:methyl-accepting chemotaxis protein